MKKIIQSMISILAVTVFMTGCELMDAAGKKVLPFMNPDVPISADGELKSLTVEGFSFSPDFDPATLDYTLYVSSATSSLTIAAIGPDGANVSAAINGGEPAPVTEADGYTVIAALDASPAENSVVITVVSEDTLTTTAYTLHVYYLSSDAYLNSLSVTADTGMITTPFAPVFSPSEVDGTTHTLTLSHLATQVTVNLALGSPVMTAMVDGWDASNYSFSVPIADLPPTAGDAAARTRTIDVVVYAQDYDPDDDTLKTHKITYKIAITMGEAPSNEARLSALTFKIRGYLDLVGTYSERNIGFTMDDYMLSYTRIWSDGGWRAYRLIATPVSSEITSITARGSYLTGNVALTNNGDGTYTITYDHGYGNQLSYPLTVYIDITAKDTTTVKTYSVTIYDD